MLVAQHGPVVVGFAELSLQLENAIELVMQQLKVPPTGSQGISVFSAIP